MEMANQLVGITMPEPSRVVAVDIAVDNRRSVTICRPPRPSVV